VALSFTLKSIFKQKKKYGNQMFHNIGFFLAEFLQPSDQKKKGWQIQQRNF
jgi:hypothetical protein